jgi:carbamoyl-phosphate synthase/aspartate carbamoyltransferase
LTDNNIPAIYGVDTRALTKKLREHGSILGRLEVVRQNYVSSRNKLHHRNSTKTNLTRLLLPSATKGLTPKGNHPEMFEDPNERNLVSEVSTKSVVVYGKDYSTTIIAYDCGMKYNIIRYFVETHKVQLHVVPSTMTWKLIQTRLSGRASSFPMVQAILLCALKLSSRFDTL